MARVIDLDETSDLGRAIIAALTAEGNGHGPEESDDERSSSKEDVIRRGRARLDAFVKFERTVMDSVAETETPREAADVLRHRMQDFTPLEIGLVIEQMEIGRKVSKRQIATLRSALMLRLATDGGLIGPAAEA